MNGDPPARTRPAPYGFTLLEIMVVLAVMAVVVAVVVPDFFSGLGASLDTESRRLQVALRLAANDAQIYGVPVRWTANAHSYRFGKWDTTGKWQVMEEAGLKPYTLPSGIGIAEVRQGQAVSLSALMFPSDAAHASKQSKDKEDPRVGQVLFWPDGSLTQADIELVRGTPGTKNADNSRVLRLRPGPDGIRVTGKGK